MNLSNTTNTSRLIPMRLLAAGVIFCFANFVSAQNATIEISTTNPKATKGDITGFNNGD